MHRLSFFLDLKYSMDSVKYTVPYHLRIYLYRYWRYIFLSFCTSFQFIIPTHTIVLLFLFLFWFWFFRLSLFQYFTSHYVPRFDLIMVLMKVMIDCIVSISVNEALLLILLCNNVHSITSRQTLSKQLKATPNPLCWEPSAISLTVFWTPILHSPFFLLNLLITI